MDIKELSQAANRLLCELGPSTPVVVVFDGQTGIVGGVEVDLGPTIVLYVDQQITAD